MRVPARPTLLGILSAGLLACASTPQPLQFSEVPPAPPGDAFPNWPHPPITTLEELQKADRARIEVRQVTAAGGGVTGAEKVQAHLPTFHADLKFKVKRVPPRLDGLNNSPRKEVAAYRLQQFFLDPVDYVVPTTALRCVSLDDWRRSHGSTSPTVDGTNCVLVTLAFWLKKVTLPDPLYNEERFVSDPRYAYHLANFNVLTHLVDHRDNRRGNFLVSSNDDDRRVFAIDNGTTFGAWLFNWFYPPNAAWRKFRVPALPRVTLERLRELRRKDLDRLAVVTQLEADDAGILRIEAPGEAFDPAQGARLRGTTVQFGLTRDEIDAVWQRIQELIEAVDEGRLAVF